MLYLSRYIYQELGTDEPPLKFFKHGRANDDEEFSQSRKRRYISNANINDIEFPTKWVSMKEVVETLCSLSAILANAMEELHPMPVTLASKMEDFNGRIQEFELIMKDDRVLNTFVLGRFR